jgi:hypothetical protein
VVKGYWSAVILGFTPLTIAALLIMVGGILLKVFDKPRMGLSVLLIALGVAIGGWFY